MRHVQILTAALGVFTLAGCAPEGPDDSDVRRATAALGAAPGIGGAAPLVPDETRAMLIEVATADLPAYRAAPASAQGRAALARRQEALLDRLPAAARERSRSFEHTPYVASRLDEDAIETLRRDPRVVRVIPDGLEEPLLEDSIALIQADVTMDGGADGTGALVAVLDTGVDGEHAMLAGRMAYEGCTARGGDECPNGVEGETAAAPCIGEAAGVRGCGHGTHVAGIAAGDGLGLTGVAPSASIMAFQVFHRVDSDASCNGNAPCLLASTSDIMDALDTLIDLREEGWNLAAVNMSLGSRAVFEDSCDGDARAPQIARLRELGVATVIASGNRNSNTGVSAPGCISDAVTVGNTTKDDVVAGSSNSSDQVDLLAPGTRIESADVNGATSTKTGTSMAAPHVAGALAALRGYEPSVPMDTLVDALIETGVPITDPDNDVSKPRIRVASALRKLAKEELDPDHRVVNRGGAQCRGLDGPLRYTSGGYVQNDGDSASGVMCPALRLRHDSGFSTEGFGRAYVVDRNPTDDVCCHFESKNPAGGRDVGEPRCSEGASADMQIIELSFPKVDLQGTWGHFHLVCELPRRHDGSSSQLRTYRVYQQAR